MNLGKTLIIIILGLALFSACEKNQDYIIIEETPIDVEPIVNKIVYEINGVTTESESFIYFCPDGGSWLVGETEFIYAYFAEEEPPGFFILRFIPGTMDLKVFEWVFEIDGLPYVSTVYSEDVKLTYDIQDDEIRGSFEATFLHEGQDVLGTVVGEFHSNKYENH